MKSMHHTIRTISLGMALALLVVTAAAAMIGVFSGPASTPFADRPAATAPTPKLTQPGFGDDTVLYERVASSDGSTRWVLTREPDAARALHQSHEATAITNPAATDATLRPVSYALLATPAYMSRGTKNCTRPANAIKSKEVGGFDLSCASPG